MVDRSAHKTNTTSSLDLKMISSICTSPLYRKEHFIRQKYLVENMSAGKLLSSWDAPIMLLIAL